MWHTKSECTLQNSDKLWHFHRLAMSGRIYEMDQNDYETPAKKLCVPSTLSPDLGCFMDFCTPPAQDSSPFATSLPAFLDEPQADKSDIKALVSSELKSEHVGCRSSTEPGSNKENVPQSLKRQRIPSNLAPDFDFDVDDILCLFPLVTSAAGGVSDDIESGEKFQDKPIVIPSMAHGQDFERGDGLVKEEREEQKKEMKYVEEDKGYLSISYIKDLELEKTPSPSVSPQLPPAASSPLVKRGEKECRYQSSPEPGCQKQAALSGQHFSFIDGDLCPVVSGPILELISSPVVSLDGDVEELWSIGPPILESSMVHTVKVSVGSEQQPQGSEELGGVTEPNHTTFEAGSTLNTSGEATLPLQVQVKSVVVVPVTSSIKQATCLLPATARPAVFNTEGDWEREKHLYVQSVARHLKCPQAEGDPMTELQNLMTHVADGQQWQHPSDLTKRNYQRRFGNTTMSLSAWQEKHDKKRKRFA